MSSLPRRWTRHEDLAMRLTPTVPREEYLAYMTFQQQGLPILSNRN